MHVFVLSRTYFKSLEKGYRDAKLLLQLAGTEHCTQQTGLLFVTQPSGVACSQRIRCAVAIQVYNVSLQQLVSKHCMVGSKPA